MTAVVKISQLPVASITAAAVAAVVQDGRTKKYALGTAAGKDTGTEAGDVPLLGTGGVLSTTTGGTGLSLPATLVAHANKFTGYNAAGVWGLHSLPGNTPSIPDYSIAEIKMADNSCSSRMYQDASILTAHIGTDQISRDLIKAAAVGSTEIANSVINQVHLNGRVVGTSNLILQSVTTAVLAVGAVTNSVVANNANIAIGKLNIAGTESDTNNSIERINGVWTFAPKGTNSGGGGGLVIGGTQSADDLILSGGTNTQNWGKISDANVSATAAINPFKIGWGGTRGASKLLGTNADNTAIEYVDPIDISIGDGSLITRMYADASVTGAKIANATIPNAALAGDISIGKLDIEGTESDVNNSIERINGVWTFAPKGTSSGSPTETVLYTTPANIPDLGFVGIGGLTVSVTNLASYDDICIETTHGISPWFSVNQLVNQSVKTPSPGITLYHAMWWTATENRVITFISSSANNITFWKNSSNSTNEQLLRIIARSGGGSSSIPTPTGFLGDGRLLKGATATTTRWEPDIPYLQSHDPVSTATTSVASTVLTAGAITGRVEKTIDASTYNAPGIQHAAIIPPDANASAKVFPTGETFLGGLMVRIENLTRMYYISYTTESGQTLYYRATAETNWVATTEPTAATLADIPVNDKRGFVIVKTTGGADAFEQGTQYYIARAPGANAAAPTIAKLATAAGNAVGLSGFNLTFRNIAPANSIAPGSLQDDSVLFRNLNITNVAANRSLVINSTATGLNAVDADSPDILTQWDYWTVPLTYTCHAESTGDIIDLASIKVTADQSLNAATATPDNDQVLVSSNKTAYRAITGISDSQQITRDVFIIMYIEGGRIYANVSEGRAPSISNSSVFRRETNGSWTRRVGQDFAFDEIPLYLRDTRTLTTNTAGFEITTVGAASCFAIHDRPGISEQILIRRSSSQMMALAATNDGASLSPQIIFHVVNRAIFSQ